MSDECSLCTIIILHVCVYSVLYCDSEDHGFVVTIHSERIYSVVSPLSLKLVPLPLGMVDYRIFRGALSVHPDCSPVLWSCLTSEIYLWQFLFIIILYPGYFRLELNRLGGNRENKVTVFLSAG